MKLKIHLINGEVLIAETYYESFEAFKERFDTVSNTTLYCISFDCVVNWNIIAYIEEFKEADYLPSVDPYRDAVEGVIGDIHSLSGIPRIVLLSRILEGAGLDYFPKNDEEFARADAVMTEMMESFKQ